MNIGECFYCSKCMKKIKEEMICPYCGHNPEHLTSENALEEGTLLQKGRYQLGTVLGSGGFGITYAAWDYTLCQPVAIKEYFPKSFISRNILENNCVTIIKEHQAAYEIGLRRFNREARILSSLQNIKNVVAVHDWFEANGTAYIVMEYVRGKNLEQYVKENQIAPAELIAMLKDLIDSLAAIHAQGVLHRDISPSNLMVQEDGTVKLIDFGNAATEERLAEGKDRTVIFNRAFAPIEQYDENSLQGPWTDVYALSATLYYLIVGELPLQSLARTEYDTLKPLRSKQIRLKKYQKKAIQEGMVVSPQKRIQSMEIFRSILYHLPMPEEIKYRRKFMIKIMASVSAIAAIVLLIFINMIWGFPGPQGLQLGIRSDGVHIIGFYGSQNVLTIPPHIIGLPVTAIDSGAFSLNSNLDEVTIPGSVKFINSYAFNSCESLLCVTIEEGNQSIGEYAFSNCTSLRTIIIPSSTQQISSNAFSESASALTIWLENQNASQSTMIGTEIHTAFLSDYETVKNHTGVSITGFQNITTHHTLSDSLTMPDYIGNQPITAFEVPPESILLSTELTSVKLPEKLELLPKGVISDHHALEEVTLGTELKEIGAYALYNTSIKELEFPDTLETIGEYAFSQSLLNHVILPDSVSNVGNGAFYCCTQLTSVVLSDQIKSIPFEMFHSCTKLTDVVLPKNLESIGHFSFANCTSLESIMLPSTVKTIEAYAFSECESLRIIYIPPSTEQIAIKAFDGCSRSMVIAGISDTIAQYYAEQYGFPFLAIDQWDYSTYGISENSNLLIMEGAKEEEYTELPSVYAGDKCYIVNQVLNARLLKSHQVALPQYAVAVTTTSFAGNNYLTEVFSNENLQKIGDMAFFQCKNLQTFHFENGILEIGSLAFAKDENLTDVYLPETLEHIGYNAFWGCENLTNINIPKSLTLLDNGCFSETGITSVTIPGNIVKCKTTFYGCKNLQEALLEEGVQTVHGTFSQCPALETVVFPSTIKEISRSTFHGCTSLKDVWIYSIDADLDFVFPSLNHINKVITADGDIQPSGILLEPTLETTPLLFADCPNVTIHGYANSTSEAYAREHNVSFEIIE